MGPARGVTANDHALGCEGTTTCGAVAGEGGYIRARFQVPHLQCPVIRRGDRTPPVRTHRLAADPVRAADQGAQFSAAIPGLNQVECGFVAGPFYTLV